MTENSQIRGTLFIRENDHSERLLLLLAEQEIDIDPNAIAYAREVLSDDWLTVWAGAANSLCSLNIKNQTRGVNLLHWAEILQSVYELRTLPGMAEQIKRLRLISHERLDTAFMLTVAARYQRYGFKVDLEPNGLGCSDLRLSERKIEKGRFYVEVKRVNTQEHRSPANRTALATSLLEILSHLLVPRLEELEYRLEVKFLRGFSPSLTEKIADELAKEVPLAEMEVETPMKSLKGSSFIVLHRESGTHYQKGMFSARISIKQPGVPIQVAPRNMPVRIGFDWPLNMNAVRSLLKKALRQLEKDLRLDSEAETLVVLEADGGEQLASTIEKRFLPNFPDSCLGITLISDPPFVITKENLSEDKLNFMKYAATSFFTSRPLGP